jgi:hypothetical protein
MKITKYELIITLAFVLVLFFSIKSCSSNKNELAEKENLYRVVADSMVTYRNKLGEQVAKIEPLITTNQKYFLELKTKDSTILKLQALVKEESKKRHDIEIALVISNQTVYDLKDSIKNKIIGQTSEHKGDSIYVWPTYERVTVNKWLNDTIQIGKAVFSHKLTVYNEYDITIGTEPNGLFKRKAYAQIVNKNPYTQTVDMRVYQKKEVPSKFWSYIGGGIVGAGIVWLVKSL